MGAERRPHVCLGLETGIGVQPPALGCLLRVHDALSPCRWLSNSSNSRALLAKHSPSGSDLRRLSFHLDARAAVRSPVLTRLVRLSRPAGRFRRLLRELSRGFSCASALLPRTQQPLSQLFRKNLGNHRFRFEQRICGLGRPPQPRSDRWNCRPRGRCRIAAVRFQ